MTGLDKDVNRRAAGTHALHEHTAEGQMRTILQLRPNICPCSSMKLAITGLSRMLYITLRGVLIFLFISRIWK